MKTFYIKNPDAGKHNGGYCSVKELIQKLVIEKNGVKIELTGEDVANLYNFIRPVTAPKM
jgi:hypothetical protein